MTKICFCGISGNGMSPLAQIKDTRYQAPIAVLTPDLMPTDVKPWKIWE